MLCLIFWNSLFLSWTTQAQKTGQDLARDGYCSCPGPSRPLQRKMALLAAPAPESGQRGGVCRRGGPSPVFPRCTQCPVLRDPCSKLPPPQGAAFCVAQVLSLNLQLSLLPSSCVSNHPHGSGLPLSIPDAFRALLFPNSLMH